MLKESNKAELFHLGFSPEIKGDYAILPGISDSKMRMPI